MAYICMSAGKAARPAHGEQPACGPWTLMRVRPPPSVRISRAAAFPGTISVKLSTSCSATYLLLTAVRRPPPLEVEVAPVSASLLLKSGVYRSSRSAAATCISCARVAIPVSWSMMAKPPSWGSMLVMSCSLSVQAAGPRRRRSLSWRDRSGVTRPLRRFQERSQRASSAACSWSQVSRIGSTAGSAGAARSPRCGGAMRCGEPAPRGAHRGARGAGPVPRGRILDGLHCWLPGPLRPPPFRPPGPPRAGPPGGGGAGRTGHATGISVPSPGGCGRRPPYLPLGRRHTPRATPVVPASPRLCSTCPHIGSISLVSSSPVPGGAAPTCGWRPPAPGQRAGWPAEPCAAPMRGRGRTHRGLVSRARVQAPGRRRAARPPAAILASVWRRLGGQACPSIAGLRRPGASDIPWSGPPAGA